MAATLTGDDGHGAARWLYWVRLVAALLLLNASLTFANLWPTPAVTWRGQLSIELAVFVLGLLGVSRQPGRPSARARRRIVSVWLLLVLGRYLLVTAPALWGRELNFYWDLRFLPDVAGMIAGAAPVWILALAVAGLILAFQLVRWLVRRAMNWLCDAATAPGPRVVMAAAGGLVVALYFMQPATVDEYERLPLFTPTVTGAYAGQVRLVAKAITGLHGLPDSPPFDSNLSRVQGADVLLVFLESYGAVAYETPAFSQRLTPSRAALETSIRESGKGVVSAFVQSPTFGGSSWFAHVTLLSGIDIRDPDANALLMTKRRDTLSTMFGRHGYRAIAVMPGLRSPWPEGAFYGFNEIYNLNRLAYTGPTFGWWNLTDQFVLAKLDALEIDRTSRPPVFVFMPTVSTHMPFAPTPPYQPDWSRMLTDQPYDEADVDRAYYNPPDWLDLGPSYTDAVAYAYDTIGGYVRKHAGGDFVMILIGDHQPPALVSGDGAPWDVPVHVIANRRDILDLLVGQGFRDGMAPSRPSLGPMSTLTPILLDAFGSRDTANAAR